MKSGEMTNGRILIDNSSNAIYYICPFFNLCRHADEGFALFIYEYVENIFNEIFPSGENVGMNNKSNMMIFYLPIVWTHVLTVS